MDELKPCPFCGGKAFIATIEHAARPDYKYHGEIMCRNCQATCGTTGFDRTKSEADKRAVLAWNRRAVNVVRCSMCKYVAACISQHIPAALESNGYCSRGVSKEG